ncbi:MAG: trypsin-like peptidase domain-containing protein [Sedimentisphaerales bacterium]|nr:trypsin-like peptidase domain-containing protein [Sedimentisphaerales bacterium]
MLRFSPFGNHVVFLRVLLVMMVGSLLTGVVKAEVIGTDNFNYPDGQIDGKNGGTGWTWHNASGTQTNSGGKSTWGVGAWGDPLNWGMRDISGGALYTTDGGAIRAYGGNAWEASFEGAGCVYYSVKFTMLEDQWWCGVSGYDFDGERFFFGKPSGESVFGIDSWPSDDPGYWLSSINVSVNQTFHLICAIDYDGNQLRLWINPSVSDYDNGAADNTADVAGAYAGGNWNNQIRLASGGACMWDNLIVANSFADLPVYFLNDDCSGALPITEGVPETGSTATATGTEVSSCSSNDFYDVWYYFIPAETGPYEISTCGSSFDTTLAIYDGCGGTEVACNEDAVDICGGYQSNLVTTLTSGVNYKIRIAGWEQQTGDYILTVNQDVPDNDDCFNATEAVAWHTYSGNTIFATGADVSSCTNGDTIDVWYRFVPMHTDEYRISTEGSSFDTSLAVYTSCGGGEIGCNDDANGGQYSELTLNLTRDAPYFIRISGYEGAKGDYSLKIIPTCPDPIAPTAPTPENLQSAVTREVTLSWNGTIASIQQAFPAVIYGVDNRLDEYQVTDSLILDAGDATCALMGSSVLTDLGDSYLIDGSYTLADSIQDGWGLPICPEEPYANQPLAAYCSGSLVAPDIIMTAGHCVDSANIDTLALVFGFVMLDAYTPTLEIDKGDVYFGREVIAQGQDSDWALVRLDRPVVGHTPRQVRRGGKIGNTQTLLMIGHPCGMPRKYAGGARVRENAHDEYFEANLDAYGGNSGSAVFNATNLTIEGILVAGNPDWQQDGDCVRSKVCPDSGCPDWEAVSRVTQCSSLIPLYDVYLGEAPDQMSLLCQDTNVYWCDAGLLECGKTYYWQVVEKNGCGQIAGPIWAFTVEPVGDLDFSCMVDINDYALFAASWLGDNCSSINSWCGNADLNKDGQVNVFDIDWLAQYWLKYVD